MRTTEGTEYTEGKYPYSEITDKIIKCAIEVHKTLGPGFYDSEFFSDFSGKKILDIHNPKKFGG